ncbi:restriction endonuclease [Streptomyces rishiriensis]|uniref:Restriction system protein n=1 Tax=Streptomyces rishiriensis TaxID=68264 RepID=A0ABU0P1C4_STRRH|nr:restriction endonuclease [Streptomyces rishiriensis]MDQ0585197.1 restriction system protein [Streptomyces rishiriensis]
MAVPPHDPQSARSPRRFELRSTAVYFVLLAILLVLLGTVARTVVAAAERRPGWAVAVVLVGAAAVLAGWRGQRRVSAARLARRTARSLEAATETVVDALDAAPAVVCAGPAGAGLDMAPTIRLDQPLDDVQAVTEEIRYEEVDPYELDPYEFEQAIAELCRRDGCTEVEVVGGAGDLGADVVARTPDGRVLVIQCKRYGDTHRVGSQDMQRFGGTCFPVHGAEVAAVVTTGDFTAPAVDYARQCGIVCVDGEDLRQWREAAGPRLWEPEFVAG